MARPTKLTAQARTRIAQAVALGATYEHAAQAGGVSYDTFNSWMKRGEHAPPSSPFRQFFDAIKTAEGEAVMTWLARIELAAKSGTWQAAAWKLERRYPQSYGWTPAQRVEVTGKNGGPLQHEHAATVVLYMPDNGRDAGAPVKPDQAA